MIKLTLDTVNNTVALLRDGDKTQAAVAKAVGISNAAVSVIARANGLGRQRVIAPAEPKQVRMSLESMLADAETRQRGARTMLNVATAEVDALQAALAQLELHDERAAA